MKQFSKMQNARRQKNKKLSSGKDLTGSGRKTEKFFICPYCSQKSDLIWVHGHYQCSNCKTVIVSCCNGSTEE